MCPVEVAHGRIPCSGGYTEFDEGIDEQKDAASGTCTVVV
jgi:hypothetical protein